MLKIGYVVDGFSEGSAGVGTLSESCMLLILLARAPPALAQFHRLIVVFLFGCPCLFISVYAF